MSPPSVRSSRWRCDVSRWDNAVPARNKRVRRGCLIRQAVWLVGASANEFRRGSPHQTAVWLVGASANEFRRGSPHQTGCLARWCECQRVSARFASSDRQSGSLVRVPTSVGRLPHQTVVWVVCVRNVPSGAARGDALWTPCVSGAAPPVVSAGGAEPRGAATVESLLPPEELLAPAR